MENNEFIFVIEDLTRNKFKVAALQFLALQRPDTSKLFSESKHNLNVLDDEFSRGNACLIVVQKERALEEAIKLVGQSQVRSTDDWESQKSSKQKSF